jgi:hypothetical protein
LKSLASISTVGSDIIDRFSNEDLSFWENGFWICDDPNSSRSSKIAINEGKSGLPVFGKHNGTRLSFSRGPSRGSRSAAHDVSPDHLDARLSLHVRNHVFDIASAYESRRGIFAVKAG